MAIAKLVDKIFGTYSQRELKKIYPLADKVMALDEEYSKLTDEELKAKTAEFKERYQNGETLDDLLPEAFATVREAAWRVLEMKHFYVQVVGGIVLHQGRIAEMRTGEGKTLVATLPAYLNALTGKGVHIVTVNDYLAKRDSEQMGKVYRFLGLTVGLVIHSVDPMKRKSAYQADITYGTNNEFGFDYLRDNMAIYKQSMVQRGHNFVIVDEVDSILIDEARTPLIISGQGEKSTDLYKLADRLARQMTPMKVKEIDAKEEQDELEADYIVDEKAKTAVLTPHGQKKAEKYFNIENLSDPENVTLAHHVNQAIKARGVMQKDVDYVVKDGKVLIVDEFTGRIMYGRRYSDGLHQAIEAKEGVEVEHESKTLATITFQNFFRLYSKISGMTGTALTEEDEFRQIYNMDVIEIPTNKPMIRKDHPDCVYKNEHGKMICILRKIQECHAKGQPILVGTISIEKSEEISRELKKLGIKHTVLNAKFHEQEAEIVAQAGKPGAVTIATNMAGRGTDIMLGGNAEQMAQEALKKDGYDPAVILQAIGHAELTEDVEKEAREKYHAYLEKFEAQIKEDAEKVRAAGGLYILGTERHESRRIDNQLRGRAGRQGDPGESCFYISLEDDLMRLFGSEKIQKMMESLGIEDDEPVDQKILSNAIESAQKKVENRNFTIRKNVLEYDDVMNTQRNVIYSQRMKVLNGENVKENILSMVTSVIEKAVHSTIGEKSYVEQSDIDAIRRQFLGLFLTEDDLKMTTEELDELTPESLINIIDDIAKEAYEKKEEELTPEIMREAERVVLLRNVDTLWMDHIDAMTELRNGIGLRAYGQHDPKVEYKREGYDMFEEMIDMIKEHTVRSIFTLRLRQQSEEPKREQVAKETGTSGGSDETVKQEPVKVGKKIGRNDPCPCGSGLKYKKCCGKNQ
jgi:preprotein translocase subunit SecA